MFSFFLRLLFLPFSIEPQVIEKLAIQRKSGQYGTVIAPLGLDPRGVLNWAGHNGKYDLNAAHVRGAEELATLQGTRRSRDGVPRSSFLVPYITHISYLLSPPPHPVPCDCAPSPPYTHTPHTHTAPHTPTAGYVLGFSIQGCRNLRGYRFPAFCNRA